MYPHGPSPSFVWTSFKKICWVPNNYIPSPTMKSSRSHVVSEADIINILSTIEETIHQIELFLQFHNKGYIGFTYE